ncbi:hypothetical protein BAY61_13175 [Prauserella marina]|uniref:Phenyloxazoline synthase MbtB n=1 Tax=Prauserella marina TaxID=530584 RepID=A0A222VPG7_9PSEU|nr:non-ribosomal peptide synthetase [Prauserella marina]ASR35797.1 hypothetical protein BAY61_13175 [Prauserella marina]PWV84302.1 amino acid adenylation domain-containing protein [Prauserella marina]SDC25842.1 amino acid adenylation domain-containing protein [Prauserella marina]
MSSSEPAVDIEDVTGVVGDVLGTTADALGADVPLPELGLESFTAVRLRRRLREDFGLDLPLTAFLGTATIRSIAHGVTDPGGAVDEHPDTGGLDSEPLPLTPIQAAYWVGRDPAFPLGGVATFFYREYDRTPEGPQEADLENLTTAWNRLVRRHPMLRMVVGADARQRVLGTVAHYDIDVTDLRHLDSAEAEEHARRLRDDRSHQVRPSDTWPLFDLSAIFLPGGRTRLCLGIDVLAVDFAGWLHLLAEWGTLVGDPSAELPTQPTTFAEIVRAREADPARRRRRDEDLAYWASRVGTLPGGPALPVAEQAHELRGHRFTRAKGQLPPQEWSALRARAAEHGLSPTGLLLAAFGLTLNRWGSTEPFCLNATLFDRPDDQDLSAVLGDFTSTVLVELPVLDPARWSGFADYALRTNRRFWTDLDHRSVSGVEALRAAGNPEPRYPVVFTSGLGLATGDDPAAWLGEEVFGISQTPQVLFDHIVYVERGALTFCWDTVEGAFPDGFIEGMLTAHLRLLRRLADDPSAWTDRVLGWDPSFLPSESLDVTPFGAAGPLLPDPLHAAGNLAPDADALLGPSATLSHKELTALAARTGAALAGLGLGPGDLVAVSAEKGPAQIVAMLGICASGAGYVPVEPSWPANRVASVCEQAGIRHALVAGGTSGCWPDEVTVHDLRQDGTIAVPVPDVPGPDVQRPAPDDLAYVIFTSGSTGKPKGVAIEHRAARTTIDDLVDRFPLRAEDRMLALSAFSFDLSVHDVFGVLGTGGALVLPEAARQRDPGHWLELMREHGVTLWNTAPALMEMLVEYAEVDPGLARAAFSSLRLVFLSADWIPVTLPDRIRALAPEATVVSLGGATEGSIWSICHPIGEVPPSWRSIPYGRALRGQSFHILDENGSPKPAGQPGELHIGGGGLARGYVGDPRQTAERFITHPELGRLYRTGDMGRWRYDGTIEFLGRLDRQVKIRGHRIELGEVESVLDRLADVRKSVALSVPGPDDRPRLVAYVAGHGDAVADDQELRTRLRAHVPEYMVPSRFVPVDEFPVTANGKIDYQALGNPYARGEATVPEVTSEAPAPGALAEALAEACRSGLDVTITLSAGSLSLVDGMSAAGEQGRRLLTTATAEGLSPRQRQRDGTLVELALSADPPGAETLALAQPHASAEPARRGGTALRRAGDAVRRVFAELLRTDIDGSTPFFQLGATSLTLVQAQRKLSAEIDPELTVVDLLANATADDLAAVIADRIGSTARENDVISQASPAPPPDPGRGRATARARARELLR